MKPKSIVPWPLADTLTEPVGGTSLMRLMVKTGAGGFWVSGASCKGPRRDVPARNGQM